MAEEKKEPWLNYLALTTVILAVCATLATFKGGGYSTRSVISQAQASDQWAFYQAKSIKSNLYTLQKERLALDLSNLPSGTPALTIEHFQKDIADAEAKIRKYEKEKADIEKTAKALEMQRDEAQKHGQPFGFAVIFLQVAILISSIAGLFKRRGIWFVALPIGALGLILFANGFLLFI